MSMIMLWVRVVLMDHVYFNKQCDDVYVQVCDVYNIVTICAVYCSEPLSLLWVMIVKCVNYDKAKQFERNLKLSGKRLKIWTYTQSFKVTCIIFLNLIVSWQMTDTAIPSQKRCVYYTCTHTTILTAFHCFLGDQARHKNYHTPFGLLDYGMVTHSINLPVWYCLP